MNYDDATPTTTLTTDLTSITPDAPTVTSAGRAHRLPTRRPARAVLRDPRDAAGVPWRPASQDELAPSGARARVRANLAALRVLAELGALPTGRDGAGAGGQLGSAAATVAATQEQRRVLARWSGWGAVPQLFDRADARWAAERDELAELLDPSALAAAARSTLNAHYTDLGIVTALWDAVTALGFGAHTGSGDASGATVLEPGCGSGNFLHHAPEGAEVVAVEQDPTTAAIAAALHPPAAMRCESFADTPLLDASFDLAIGNVPFGAVTLHDRRHNAARLSIHDHFIVKALALVRPGGLVAVLTSRYTLDARRPLARREIAALADLVGAIRLPSGAHDRAAGTDAVSDLLILRRRDEHLEPRGPRFERATPVADLVPDRSGDSDARAVSVNAYFAEHPSRVLGDFALRSGPYSAASLHVDPHHGAPLAEQLAAALADVVAEARADGLTMTRPRPDASPAALPKPRQAAPVATGPLVPTAGPATGSAAGPAVCEGMLVVDADSGTGFARVAGGRPRAFEVPAAQAEELRALLGLRDAVVGLLDLEAAERDETAAMRARRAELGTRYGAYLAEFGPITRYTARAVGQADPSTGQRRTSRSYPRQGGFRADPYASAVYALEHGFDPDLGTALPADIFRGRVVSPRAPRGHAENPADALAICLDQHARVDLEVIAGLLGVDAAGARDRLGDLVFTDPAPGAPNTETDAASDDEPDVDDTATDADDGVEVLMPAAEYLSGDVRAKLAIAETAAERSPALARNVAALRAVIPADLAPGEITAHLGAAWIDAPVIETFVREVLGDPSARVEHPGGSVWEVHATRYGVAATQTWGTLRRSAGELVAALCEQRPIRVHDTIETPGGTRQVLNVTDTLAAQDKARELAERFSGWVWEDPERARALARVYNDRFNAIVLRSYDGAGPDTLSLPGLAENFTPRGHQYAAVARMIAEPAVLLAHDVGAGKTSEIAIGVMELRRLGLVRKPAVVVPNHMLEQWAREFTALYPRARLLVATRDDVAADRRRDFVARIATGDWDAVLMTRSAFERIPLSRERQQDYLDQETARLQRWIDGLNSAGGAAGGDRSVKRVQRMMLAAIERIKAKLDGASDAGVTFEQTGIDYVCVDEAHLYKNLRTPSNIAGAAIDGSQRAQDLDMKLWWLRAQNGPRIATLATATPVANSITETFVMQRYTRPDLLVDAGIEEFDQWAATFGQVVTTVEMTPDAAGFRLTERFARFTNVPELLRLWHVSADIKTADDLALPVPALAPRPEDGARAAATITVAPSAELREFVASLGARADAIRRREVQPQDDNMLKVCSEGRAAALDLRLLGRAQPGQATVDHAAATITRIWRAHRSDRFSYPDGTPHPVPGALQIVFCDLGTPTSTRRGKGAGGGFDVYRGLRERLVARGMPAKAVRFIHDAATDAAKGALFAAARSGEVAVLVGSTEKMGVGANVQARAVALHHLDCPWRPADLHQRDGRIRRQGNPYPEVQIFRYITEGSFDGYSWQTVARKSAFIDQVMHGRLDVREIDDIGENTLSFDEVKALASGDPRVIEKARLDAEVATLERLERAHWRTQRHLHHTITGAEDTIAKLEADLAGIDQAIAARRSTRGDGFAADLDTPDGTGTYGDPAGYTDRAPFAAALAHTLADHGGQAGGRTGARWARGATVEIGHLGGLTLVAAAHRDRDGQLEYHLEFAEAPGDPVVVDRDRLAAGGTGVLAALERRHQRLDTRRSRTAGRLDNARRERALAQQQTGAGFARADELADKQARAAELHRAMTDLARPEPEPNQDGDGDGDVEREENGENAAGGGGEAVVEPTA